MLIRRVAQALGLLSAALIILGIARRLDPLPEGLTGTYFEDIGWSSTPVQSALDPLPSLSNPPDVWHSAFPETFSATWSGSFIAMRPGRYTFATASDDGSWVYVDGRNVVDNGGHHSVKMERGTLELDRGIHSILVTYFQDGGTAELSLLWARDNAPLETMPTWAFSSRHPSFARFVASVILRRALRGVLWLWTGALAVLAVVVAVRTGPPLVVQSVDALVHDRVCLALTGIVIGSTVMNLIGIWWGLPSGWAGDELTPKAVLTGLEAHFSNGWFDRYPPFHLYVLSLVFSPWLWLKSWGWVHASDLTEYGLLIFFSRLVSIVAGAGTLVAIFVAGRRAFGARAGLFAAASLALLTPFVYYSKTANPEVPYIFWFALSLVFYLRELDTLAVRDLVGFGLAATLSIGTKDQAYALYLLAPFPLIAAIWRSNRDRRVNRPLARAVLDRRLWTAALAAAALFAVVHNIPINPQGFIKHVKDIVGPGSQPYRMVEPTLTGRLTLLRRSWELDQRSWGWPMWLMVLGGVGLGLLERGRIRTVTIALMTIVVSYYLGFIDVILYTYDRYLLPVCVVQALFAGFLLDRIYLGSSAPQAPPRTRGAGTPETPPPLPRVRFPWHPPRSWMAGLVAGIFVYTFLYSATVDALMVKDSRYVVERWLRVHDAPDRDGNLALVATMFPLVVLPRLDDFPRVDIGTIEDLRALRPAFFVLNADYAHAVPPGRLEGDLALALQHGTVGYHMVFRYRSPAPWPWLPAAHPDLMGPRHETSVLSVLRDINPTIEVYARDH